MSLFAGKELVMFNFMEVLSAVESLYADQLKPFGRILRKRLGERLEVSAPDGLDISPAELKSICEACGQLVVEPAEGGDFCVLILHSVPNFVDCYSPHDCYAEAMWSRAALYFMGLGGSRKANMSLPGGRYSCAQTLASRSLPFLQGLSLGQICHIVQLAISKRKLLGYFNGTVVPYCNSESKAKERCATKKQAFSSMANGAAPYRRNLANWESVRACLESIFFALSRDTGPEHVMIALSAIKRIFRTRFRLELSETSLGHSKLSELLQDPRLADLCSVKLEGHGYVVVPKGLPLQNSSPPATIPPPSFQQQSAQPSGIMPQREGIQHCGMLPIYFGQGLDFLTSASHGYATLSCGTSSPDWCSIPSSQASPLASTGCQTPTWSEGSSYSFSHIASPHSYLTSPTGACTMPTCLSQISTCSSASTSAERASMSPSRSITSKDSDSGDCSEIRRLSVGSMESQTSSESSPSDLARRGSWMHGAKVKNTFIEIKPAKITQRRSHSVPPCH